MAEKPLPKIVFFDYGQTLCFEPEYDPIAGISAILRHSENPRGISPQEICDRGNALNAELNRFPKDPREKMVEIPAVEFQRYLYGSFQIRFLRPRREMEKIYWDAFAPAVPAPHIKAALAWLNEHGVRAGVISNLSFAGETLRERLKDCLPGFCLHPVVSSSDYVFRKPSPHIFQAALHLAGVCAHEAWFCGDNAVCDIEGAYEAGLTPVWYRALPRKTWEPACPHLELTDWWELPALLERGAFRPVVG